MPGWRFEDKRVKKFNENTNNMYEHKIFFTVARLGPVDSALFTKSVDVFEALLYVASEVSVCRCVSGITIRAQNT